MSTFSYDAIEKIEYDFTSIPNNSGSGFCSGKGVIPEPTQPVLEAYAAGIKKLYGLDDEDGKQEIEEAMEAGDSAAKTDGEEAPGLMALTAALCQNSPSEAELDELPNRAKLAFMKWIYGELQDPKVTTDATQA